MGNKGLQTTVLIVNFNSSIFIKLTLYALEKLSRYPYKVHILDNGSEIQDYAKLQKICGKAENVFVERHETELRSGMAHGTGLNYLVQSVDTPYFSILDADATWLKKDWDEILINQLNANKVKVIGTQASVGTKKFQDFPLMYSIFFETQAFRQLDVDFRPKDIAAAQDTGHELREKYLQAGLQGKIIEMKNTRTYQEGPFRNCICGEYYLDGDYSQIFACHFGRGSCAKFLSMKRYNPDLWYYKLRGLARFTRRHARFIETHKWIAICRRIIKSQL